MEKKNTNKIIVTVIAIALIIAIIGGSTFAYWQWVTSTDQQTLVNVTVQDGISMTIKPTTTQTTVLYPVTRTNCGKANISGYADITVTNNTGVEARPQFYLKLKIEKGGSNITSTYAQYIRYAVAEYYTLDGSGNETSTPSAYTCADAPRYSVTEDDSDTTNDGFTTTVTFNENTQQNVTGWYNSRIITELTSTGDEKASTRFPILPYGTGSDESSITFSVPANTEKTHRFKFWVWLDSSYTATTTGTSITDPLQNADITVSWSESSIVKQVTG